MAHEIVTRTLSQSYKRYSIGKAAPKKTAQPASPAEVSEVSIVEPQNVEAAVSDAPSALPENEQPFELMQEEDIPCSFDDEEPYYEVQDPEDAPEKAGKDKKARKKKFELFEPEDEDELKMKQHIEDAINSDGYYDEILPRDDGQIIYEKKKIKGWLIAAVIGLLSLSVFMIVFAVGGMLK